MSHPTLNESCQLPALTASTEKYKELVLNSTTKLQQSPESALSTLDLRSIALTKTANFDSALDDAKAMQQLSPTSALGYLREASIYSEQGKQRLVIDICNQALDIVDPKDVHYAALQRTKMDAEQQQAKCIDFISQLPVDIVITTLIPMFMHNNVIATSNPCQYLEVSHLWRDRIIQCLGGLRLVVAENDNSRQCSQVIQLAQHTKSLIFDGFFKETWLCDLISNNAFCTLKELDINGIGSSSTDLFLSSLKSVSSTLTHFHIDMRSGPSLPAATLISACPNLISLNIVDASNADLSSLPATPCLNLTSLVITYTHVEITFDQILGIWKRFPSLRHFQLHPCTDIQSALIVTDYYPSMKRLQVLFSDSGVDIMCNDEGSPEEDIGITHLSLESTLPDYPIMNVNSILERYHNTLEQIELKMDLDTSSSNIQYPQLKKLYLDSSACWIPRNAPMLQALTMTSDTILNPAVLDTTPVHLQKLQLRLALEAHLHDKARLERFLLGIAQHCQLKDLVVVFSSLDNVGTLLDAITHLCHLESLAISFTSDWRSSQMESFFDHLVQRCPRLCSLDMRCENIPSADAMSTLKQLGHLQQLGFHVNWTNDNDDFWHALEDFLQLKEIRIYYARTVDNPRIQHLKKQRPDIKFTITRFFLHPF